MIPNTVRIGGKTISVKVVEHPILNSDNQVLLGQIDYNINTITISTHKCDLQEAEDSLLHEIVHGLIIDRGLSRCFAENEEEYFVKIFTHGLYQVLKDNRLDFTPEEVPE
jgi:hypothetical protein